MKKKLLLAVVAFATLNLSCLYAAIPSSLSIQGSALAESQDPMPMKLTGSVFELYTSLQSGTYSFAGDNTIAEQTLTLDGSAPYRIRVDYTGESPAINLQKIIRVYMWAPWNQYSITDLEYNNNATFKVSNILGISGWGDDRYRIRIVFDGDITETYGGVSDTSTDLVLTNNGQWGEQGGLPERSFKLPAKYRDTGVAFDAEVNLSPDIIYTHTITDYIPNTIPTSLSIIGNAMAEISGEIQMNRFGSVYELFTSLQTGTLSFSDPAINDESITVEGENVPYLIRVNYSGETPVVIVKEIKHVTMWAPWNQHHIVELNYIGNSSFKATNVLATRTNWGFSEEHGFDDTRYRFRITYEDDVFETYGPKTSGSFDLVGNEQWGSSDYNYNLNNDKYKETGLAFNVTVTLDVDNPYTHVMEDYTPTTDNITVNTAKTDIFPTSFSNHLTIKTSDAGFAVDFISLTGATVMKRNTESNELNLFDINLPKGIYVIRVTQKGNVIATQRVVKNK